MPRFQLFSLFIEQVFTWPAVGTNTGYWPITHTHTHPFNSPFSGTTQVSRYQKGKTNLDFTEARHSEWQWHQLGHMQICTSLQIDNHASTPPLSFLQVGCPSCRPTNSVKALKAINAYQEGTKVNTEVGRFLRIMVRIGIQGNNDFNWYHFPSA